MRTNGFQLGGGTESQSTFTTNAWQVSDDVTLVRGSHQFAVGVNVAHWTSLSLANVRSPGQLSIDGTQTGGAATSTRLSDFLLGRMGDATRWCRRRRTRSTWQQTYLGRLRAGHLESRARG